MNWDDLRFVLAVARGLTLAVAARALQADPTTVGRRILAIEAGLGARLFHRTGDGYLPTPAGQLAIARAEEMEALTLSLARAVEGSDALAEGPVRLTAPEVLLDWFIIPQWPDLLHLYPGLELTFCPAAARPRLSRREAEMAVWPGRPVDPDLIGQRLGRVAVAAYGARGIDFPPEPPVFAPPRGRALSGADLHRQRLFPGSPVIARAETDGHVLSLVRTGLGVGLIDCFAGDADPGLRRVRPEPLDQYELWVTAHADMHKDPRVRAVTDFLSAIFNANRDLLEGRCAGV